MPAIALGTHHHHPHHPRWIFLALWGAKMKKGHAASLDYVMRVFENVVVQPRDAREASDVFYKQKVRCGGRGGNRRAARGT